MSVYIQACIGFDNKGFGFEYCLNRYKKVWIGLEKACYVWIGFERFGQVWMCLDRLQYIGGDLGQFAKVSDMLELLGIYYDKFRKVQEQFGIGVDMFGYV